MAGMVHAFVNIEMTANTHLEDLNTSAAERAVPADPSKQDGRLSLAANAGAVLSAFIASACCVGPLVFALLGLGGGALLVKLEPYRPIFSTITLALLGLGFWLQYRKPTVGAVALGDACDCPAPRANRAGPVMLWIATALVVGFLAFPYIAPFIWS